MNRAAPINSDLEFPRETRLAAYAIERKARRTGKWGTWEKLAVSAEVFGDHRGWTRDTHTVARNGWCCVLIRDVQTAWGVVKHAAIRTALLAEFGWAEKQRLKNELFGPDAVAVEVYPAANNVTDGADMYHLWILPPGMALPFGIGIKDPGSYAHYRPEVA